ncbi:SIMPL domain-containing protein [Prescottella equi]
MATNPVTITVTGHAQRTIAPNRCVVHLDLEFDAGTHAEAAATTASATALTDLIRSFEKDLARPLRRWSLDQVQRSRYQPYHPQDKKLPWNYRLTATAAVTFRDVDAVAAFVDRAAAIEGVNVTHLEWELTRKARATRWLGSGILPSRTRSPRQKLHPQPGLQALRGRHPGRSGKAERGAATGLRRAHHAGDGGVGTRPGRRTTQRRADTGTTSHHRRRGKRFEAT